MLIHRDKSLLLLIDLQERLMPVIHGGRQVIEACCWLLDLAAELRVPVLCSQQYPRGLGETVEALKSRIVQESLLDKAYFSCVSEPACQEAIQGSGREQVIIGGVESHVCVLQTAIELQQLGMQVFIVEEAVSSRNPHHVELALARMRQAGIPVLCREMVFFEWLQKAGSDEFKGLSKQFVS